ncbi:MAG: hypothetical protein H6Q19_775 [Bacteroidetes bacterium]|nr:hypothetical protein [Bacteroidota bacterium]
MNEATQKFIEEHREDDVNKLLLQGARYSQVDMPLAVRQIYGRQKVKQKIPSFYNCDDLLYPQKLSLEQSSSEITAKHKSNICEGKLLIDLTGGFGVDSFFFSMKFDELCYVEQNEELCTLARHNFPALGRNNLHIMNDTAEHFLLQPWQADWIYLDPARRFRGGMKAVLLSDCQPDVTTLQDALFSHAKQVMIKLSPMLDLTALLQSLKHIREVHIVAVDNECRELVVLLDTQNSNPPVIKTVNYIKNSSTEQFDFCPDDRDAENVQYTPELKQYLYEPNAAIMKSGAFSLICDRFQVDKLHVNSHLYTSDQYIEHFPGRKFRVEKTSEFNKQTLRDLKKQLTKVNISVRNFPLSVSELRQRANLSEGGEIYLFATTMSDGKKVLINCSKLK